MNNEVKNWWRSVPERQKKGLMVLGVFVAAVLIMSFGVTIGASLGKVL